MKEILFTQLNLYVDRRAFDCTVIGLYSTAAEATTARCKHFVIFLKQF